MADVLAGNLIVGIKAQLGDFKKQMDDASKKVAGLKDSMEKARSGINTAGLAIAGAGATVGVAMLAMVKSTATFGDNLNKMSLKTGESTKTLSGLAFAAGRAGTDIGTVEKGIKRAAANMYDASQGIGEAKGAFDELGISATNTDGTLRKGSELLFEFADKTKGMTDATKKAALAQDIFGRAGVDLLPLFADGAEGMHSLMEEADRLGVVMDDTTAAMGRMPLMPNLTLPPQFVESLHR